mmetsp:Transcript_8135/g.12070  ORF Transcript_8135/g.12070 Transcript_8135/m.12070 type:complete len:180 (+) Transcript_8135:38-577(+)
MLIDEVNNDSTDEEDDVDLTVMVSSVTAGFIATGAPLRDVVAQVNAPSIFLYEQTDEESHHEGYTCHDGKSASNQIESGGRKSPQIGSDNEGTDSHDNLEALQKRKSHVLNDFNDFMRRRYSSNAPLADNLRDYFSFSYSAGQATDFVRRGIEGDDRKNEASGLEEQIDVRDKSFSLIL